jgi:hypothetical protein
MLSPCGSSRADATGAKHGISFFDALVLLTKGESWLPAAS